MTCSVVSAAHFRKSALEGKPTAPHAESLENSGSQFWAPSLTFFGCLGKNSMTMNFLTWSEQV